jgi:predicted ATP-binding protein involved in virulence
LLADCLEQWSDFYYDVLLGDLVVKNDRGKIMLTRLLSHGQRNVLSMVADIAYRCAVLNPELRDRAAKETPGIVLIDELDLHLHPNWQRRIVSDLRRTFPNVQFFVTTHSPIILQNLSPETDKVIDFSGEEWSLTESSTPNDILKRMGVEIPQQDLDWLDMFHAAQKYYQVLEAAKAAGTEDPRLPALRARLDELMIPFEKNPAFAAFLEVKRAVAGIDATANGTGKTK